MPQTRNWDKTRRTETTRKKNLLSFFFFLAIAKLGIKKKMDLLGGEI